ncbi:unnamed protein product [Arabidopsis arenosa]|uniref:Uncharacterized protein n=1 Tax=Arabidopsis arenosa TaxID=38785 RepID=A0A8S2B297_ARAAE|nr:unnamed protein product [Arabidopsis arenosa]
MSLVKTLDDGKKIEKKEQNIVEFEGQVDEVTEHTHQRGLESLLSQHRDASVEVFSETVELDFFRNSFVEDSYKVAVAMPTLDELLQDTPTHVYASVWFDWRKTKFSSSHYSELVRLAALYKFSLITL